MQSKRLYKSATDRSISGVCGGLAEYFNVDSTLVRLAFVLMTLMGGPGLLIYIALAIVMPEAPRDAYDDYFYDAKPKRDEVL